MEDKKRRVRIMLDKKISEKKKKSNWTKMKFLSANMRTHGLCVRT